MTTPQQPAPPKVHTGIALLSLVVAVALLLVKFLAYQRTGSQAIFSDALESIVNVVAALIAVGSLIGGWLGGHYGRRLSPNALRIVIVVVGLIGLYRLLTV